MNKDDKQQIAKLLYIDLGLQGKEIAERLKVSPQSISAWLNNGNWKSIRAAKIGSVSNIIAANNQQILSIYDKMEEEGRAVLTDKEVTAIHKLSETNRNLQKDIDLNTIVQVFEEFIQWLIPIDNEFAKGIVDYHYEYLEQRASGKS